MPVERLADGMFTGAVSPVCPRSASSQQLCLFAKGSRGPQVHAHRGTAMIRRLLLAIACACVLGLVSTATEAHAQYPTRAYGRVWGGQYSRMDWERFYHYPYVYYPQNFWGSEYYRSSQDLYFRYPPEMRIPTYNRQWHNEYPQERRYHQGHHFILDVF